MNGLCNDNMHIHVNGEDQEIADGSSVSDLLRQLELQAERVAVEVNLKILDRGDFSKYVLHEADRIEILSFIGGGSFDSLKRDTNGQ